MACFCKTMRLHKINREVKRKNLVKSVKSCGYKR